jgi:hypothetical protein
MLFRPSRRFKTLAAALLLAPLMLNAQSPGSKPVEPPASTGKPAKASTPAIDTGVKVEDLQKTQEDIKKNFTQFKEGLFRLATRLEKSERQEAKDQAKSIKKALEEADKLSIDQQFAKLVTSLRSGSGEIDLNKAGQENKELVKSLQAILLLLETDNESLRLKEEREKLEAFLKELQNIKERQQNNQARTESKTGNKDNLSKEQQKLKDETDDVAKRMGNKDNKDGTGKPKDDRAEAKAEPKAGEKGGEGKPETEQKKSEEKQGNGKEASEGKPGDPKKGEGKEGAGGEPKKSDPKEGSEGKAGEPKPGEPKPGEPKPGEPKPGEGKPGEGKPAEAKPGEGKGEGAGKGESKPSEGKGGEAKGSGEGKPGQGQPGGGQSGSKGGQQPPPGEPQPQQPKGNELPGRKEVQEAVPHQQKAEDQIKKDERDNAGKNQDKAIEKLAEAIKEIEKRIKQLREEEMKKLLANVEARCQRMLAMQIDVYQKTKGIDEEVQKNGGQLGNVDRQKALAQGEAEGQIVVEAEKCLKLLESEGSAVAFAKVLEEVREDMIAVQRRLNTAIVDKDTQTIEENIIAMLKDMLEALKKAQKEMGEQKPSQGKPGKPGNQKLIDMLAELKLIRSLQIQVNNRTKMYGDKDKGEQSKDDLVQKELKQLSLRQVKLQEMIDKLDKGENEK